MSDIIVIGCLASVTFFNIKVFAGSYIKVDTNFGISVRTGRSIRTDIFVFYE